MPYEQDSTYLLGIYAKLWTLPAPPVTLCPGDALKLIAGDRKLSSWEVCAGMAFSLSRLLPFQVTLLNCYFEIQRGIEMQWADADFSVASSCIQITLCTYRPMAHNPSIHVNPSQPTSLVHQADKRYCAADYSFQYVLLSGCCVTKKATEFLGRQTDFDVGSNIAVSNRQFQFCAKQESAAGSAERRPRFRSVRVRWTWGDSLERFWLELKKPMATGVDRSKKHRQAGSFPDFSWLFSVSAWPIFLRGRSCIGFAAGSGPMCWARSKAFKAWWVVWGQNLSRWNWSVGCHLAVDWEYQDLGDLLHAWW